MSPRGGRGPHRGDSAGNAGLNDRGNNRGDDSGGAPARTPASAPAAPPPGPAEAAPLNPWQLRTHIGSALRFSQTGRIDPYLVWDLLTQQARHGGGPSQGLMRVLLQFQAPLARDGLSAWCALPGVSEHAATLREALQPSLGRAPESSIHTALLPQDLLPVLLAGVNGDALLRFELGTPCAVPTTARPLRDWPLPRHQGLLHTLGLIDDGCCLAHQDFRADDGRSRVLALWDQSPEAEAGGPWQHHEDTDGQLPYGYGAELSQPAISAVLRAHPGLGEAAERGVYQALDRTDWGRPGRRHGAGVMHLLAGPRALPPAEQDASRLPVVFVQLPAAVVADTSGQSLGLHVVDGARYIVARTRSSAADDSAWATTLSISLGSVAGPHDGSSMAEMALDQLAADARVAVVVAAGNCARQHLHAAQSVHQGAPGQWLLHLPADKRQDTFVQLWLPAGQRAERFQIVLKPPGAMASPQLRMGYAASYSPGGAGPQAAVVWVNRPAQGLNGGMVLIAIGPTAATPGAPPRPLATPGHWQIELLASGDQPAEVHAWVERDDRVVGALRPQQARFVRPGPGQAPLQPSHTLASLANGARTTVAGGYVASSRTVIGSSALGPRRDQGPDHHPRLCLAPVAQGPSQPGCAVPGFYSGQRSRIGGTSAAAPQVARWLAEGRLTEDAQRWLQPAAPEHLPLPADARCILPTA